MRINLLPGQIVDHVIFDDDDVESDFEDIPEVLEFNDKVSFLLNNNSKYHLRSEYT